MDSAEFESLVGASMPVSLRVHDKDASLLQGANASDDGGTTAVRHKLVALFNNNPVKAGNHNNTKQGAHLIRDSIHGGGGGGPAK